MRRIFKILKRTFLIIFGLLGIFALAVILFLNLAPQIGQAPEGEDLERVKKSEHWSEGRFQNILPTEEGTPKSILGTIKEYMSASNTSPKDSLPVLFGPHIDPADTQTFITWYGHSSFLFEMGGKTILIDPMLGDYSSPLNFGSKRFPYKEPIPMEDLKEIDVVILSHDHYDHLDYQTILKLKDEVGHFYTALGVGSHLKSWGVKPEKITELDWWQEANLGDLHFVACPSRHFSGRSLTNRNSSQWASWVIEDSTSKIYFSGDGGYGPHFKEIGEKHGPFDVALMECGQYNKAWSEIHMMPEESVQAGMDVGGKVLMPIHWGAFQLAIHEWTDPILRFKAQAVELEQVVIHPLIGERFLLGADLPQQQWWIDL